MPKSWIETARDRYKLATDGDQNQRDREREDLRFYAGDQWPTDVLNARKGLVPQGSSVPAVPDRPSIVINKVREPVRQVLNQERGSDIGVELVPADDFGDLGVTPDDTEVTLREGLVRRIQRAPEAADARTWSFSRATIAGRGARVVMTRYLPGKTNDQEVYIHRIYDQSAVRWDPSHEQPDGSDAKWVFPGGRWYLWDDYKAKWPGAAKSPNRISTATASDIDSWAEDEPLWVKSDGEDRSVYVADYFWTEHHPRTLCTMPDGSVQWKNELPKDAEYDEGLNRTVDEPTIKWGKIDGLNAEALEETVWPGKLMPVIKEIGEELHPYDTERRAEGMVRPARDSQQSFNAMVSKQVEVIAMSPIAALQVDPEAIEGYEDWYKLAATRAFPFLPYRTYDANGRQLDKAQRSPTDPNIVAIANAIQMFNDSIQATTGGSAPKRLHAGQSVQSNAAIQSLQREQEEGTSNYLDNHARSVRYEGMVINDLLYPIYGTRPGRLVRMMNGEGEHEAAYIGQAPQADGAQPPPMGQQAQKAPKVFKLTKDANFNIIVKVTKAFDSRRTQEATVIGELLGQNPELLTWFGDLFFKNQDGPGHMQMAERAKVMLDPKIQALIAQKDGQEIPPAAMAKIAALQGQVQHAEQAMQELNKALETKQVENAAKVEIEKMKAIVGRQQTELETRRDVELQRMKNATTIRVAEINALTKGVVLDHEHESDALARSEDMAHEATMEHQRRDHEREMADSAQAHAAAMGAQGHEQALAQGDQQQAGALEQQQQAADLAPEPEAGQS